MLTWCKYGWVTIASNISITKAKTGQSMRERKRDQSYATSPGCNTHVVTGPTHSSARKTTKFGGRAKHVVTSSSKTSAKRERKQLSAILYLACSINIAKQ